MSCGSVVECSALALVVDMLVLCVCMLAAPGLLLGCTGDWCLVPPVPSLGPNLILPSSYSCRLDPLVPDIFAVLLCSVLLEWD